MKSTIKYFFLIVLLIGCNSLFASTIRGSLEGFSNGFIIANDYGFSPDSSGITNTRILQEVVDQGGTVIISNPGVYKIAGTIYLGSNLSLLFGNGVYLKKVNEKGIFTHVFLNKGALTKTFNQNIFISGLQILVNGIDQRMGEIYGLRGHVAFYYIKDLRIERFRCFDLATKQFCIQICNFEDVIIDDVIIKGDKDGIHLGRGRRFTISNGIFQTVDDAIALNGHDWVTSNPEVGWIEDGIIEKCHDLNDNKKPLAFFCRLLAGSWLDWTEGIEVQLSDIVVSNGKVYRVTTIDEGKCRKSVTPPRHEKGIAKLDGISWLLTQNESTYNAGVKNIVFRDITLEKPRVSFSFHFDYGTHRSYYPGSAAPLQEKFSFDNIRIKYDEEVALFSIKTPVDVLTLSNSSIRNNKIEFKGNKFIEDYSETVINIHGCVFNKKGEFELMTNDIAGKKIYLKTNSNIFLHNDFFAKIVSDSDNVVIDSDLRGLRTR